VKRNSLKTGVNSGPLLVIPFVLDYFDLVSRNDTIVKNTHIFDRIFPKRQKNIEWEFGRSPVYSTFINFTVRLHY